MVLGELDSYMQKKLKLDHQVTAYTRINSQCIKDLNIRHNTIKFLEQNMGSKSSDIPRINIFTDTSSRARDLKENIKKWNYIKLKSFCPVKENISKWKEDQLYEKTYLPVILRTRVWSPKYINSHNSTPGRQTTQLKNGQRTWTDNSPRRTYKGPETYERMLSITRHQRDAN